LVKNFVGRENERSDITTDDIEIIKKIDTLPQINRKTNILTKSQNRKNLKPCIIHDNIIKNMKNIFEINPFFIGVNQSPFVNTSFRMLQSLNFEQESFYEGKNDREEISYFTDPCVKLDKDLLGFSKLIY
jgi:hypothetical protein